MGAPTEWTFMESLIDTLSEFIARHGAWAPWIAALIAAAETTLVVSFFVPATALMLAVGAMVTTGGVEFIALWAAATAGAVAGSVGSYALGRHYGDAILELRALQRHAEAIDRVRQFLHRWGAATVLVGHLVFFMRPVAFVTVGMSGMIFSRFFLWNLLGAMTWAWAVLKFGEFGAQILGWLWRVFLP